MIYAKYMHTYTVTVVTVSFKMFRISISLHHCALFLSLIPCVKFMYRESSSFIDFKHQLVHFCDLREQLSRGNLAKSISKSNSDYEEEEEKEVH